MIASAASRLSVLVCLLIGMAPTVHARASERGPGEVVERVSVRVPGTTVRFELVLAPGEAGQDALGDLWVLTTEVTWDLYDVYLYALDEPEGGGGGDAVTRPSKPYVPPDRGFGHAGYPAIGMTRHAGESFCVWLEAKTGIPARLPRPEEWTRLAESAAGDVGADAWTSETAGGTTHPVGKLAPNALGLHDTLGNVAEWVADGERRASAMGGSYRDAPDACTPTSVQRQTTAWNTSDPQIPKSVWWLADCSWVGFRFVVDAEKMPDRWLHADEEVSDDD